MTGRLHSTLDGLPMAIKGNFMVRGVPMNTARTKLLRDHTASEDATLVRWSDSSLHLQKSIEATVAAK